MIKIEITLAEVKEALRIDYDDEDTYLQLCLDAAKAHVEDAIDDYETKITEAKMQSKAKIAIIAITQDLFDNRVYTFASTDKSEKVKYIIQSLMQQMRY